jgi:hypothetical protein
LASTSAYTWSILAMRPPRFESESGERGRAQLALYFVAVVSSATQHNASQAPRRTLSRRPLPAATTSWRNADGVVAEIRELLDAIED